MTLETGVRNLVSRLDGSPTVVFQIRPGLLTNVKFLGLSVSKVGTPLEILKYTRRVPWVSACLWVTFVRLSGVSCKRGKLGLSTIYTQSSYIYTIFGLSSKWWCSSTPSYIASELPHWNYLFNLLFSLPLLSLALFINLPLWKINPSRTGDPYLPFKSDSAAILRILFPPSNCFFLARFMRTHRAEQGHRLELKGHLP